MNASLDMTLRDWFAGLAMQGILANGDYLSGASMAHEAYEYADAMLAERERNHEQSEEAVT